MAPEQISAPLESPSDNFAVSSQHYTNRNSSSRARSNPSCPQNQESSNEQLPPLRRRYRFFERTPCSRPQESNLAKKRRLLAGQRCPLLDNGWICCTRRRCVHAFEKDILHARRSHFLGMSCFERKTTLRSMLQSDGTFQFDGLRVCQRFIMEVLTFSNSVIAAVKGLPCARASPSAHPIQREALQTALKSIYSSSWND